MISQLKVNKKLIFYFNYIRLCKIQQECLFNLDFATLN